MEMFFNGTMFTVDSTESEWEVMWKGLFAMYGDYTSPCGESWQYMGTWLKDGLWFHQFRHRCYEDGKRRLLNILPTPSYLEQIPQALATVA
jgi:hypothetical protein